MKTLGRGISWLKDLLFPIYCVTCGKEGGWWCAPCMQIEECLIMICPNCYTPRGSCICALSESLINVTAFFTYKERGAVGTLLKQFKYRGAFDMEQLWKSFNLPEYISRDIVLVPVPLFIRRARERGYNQAELFARALADTHALPIMTKGLRRIRATEQQAKQGRVERSNNIAGAFTWGGKQVPPKRILLVDDVFTTGATMRECAQTLMQAGAKEVFGCVIAYTVPTSN